MSVLYHPGKANVVANALSRMSMGSVAHVDEDKKELVKEVHRLARLGVKLLGTMEGSMLVQNGSESSLVVDVKSKQDLDPSLMELKRLVDEKKIEVFSFFELSESSPFFELSESSSFLAATSTCFSKPLNCGSLFLIFCFIFFLRAISTVSLDDYL